MCLNRKVLGGLALAALGILAFAPSLFSRAVPLLVVAICPLSMLLMVGGIAKVHKGKGCPVEGQGPDLARNRERELAALRAEVERLHAEHPASGEEAAGPKQESHRS